MILTDVNVLVYAHRADAPNHEAFRQWLEEIINSDQIYGYSEMILGGFIRIVTHPRIFDPPSDLDSAFRFAEIIRTQPNAISIEPGIRHWEIFRHLCETTQVTGNLIPDAYFAALAIESGCEWITTDKDYGRFPGLNWRHPFSNPTG